MVAKVRRCSDCGEDFPSSQSICPHCGRPSLFPNVFAAEQPEEQQALDQRYRTALSDARTRGCEATVAEFERAVADQTKAVIATDVGEVERLAKSDRNLFSTYYELVKAGVRLPSGDKWDVLRGVAEHAMFPGYKDNIRFAALSLDGEGVWNYGECSLTLREDRSAYRASAFEANNVVMTVYQQKNYMADALDLPQGYRATWSERGRLCVAKSSGKIQVGTVSGEFSRLLVEQGTTTAGDEFVEIHLWGPISIRTVERVVVVRKGNRPLKTRLKDLESTLAHFGIPLEVRSWKP